MQSPKKEKNNKMSTFMRDSLDYVVECIFSLSYTIFITPYEVEYDPKKGSKVVIGSPWKKITSLVLTLVTVLVALISANSGFTRASIRSPAIIFKIAPDIGDTFLCFLFWYVVWTRKNEISHFFSLMNLRTYETWRVRPYKTPQKIFVKLFPENSIGGNKNVKAGVKVFVALSCAFLIALIVAFDLLKLCGRCVGGHMVNSSFIGCIFQDVRQGLFFDAQTPKPWSEVGSFEIGAGVWYLAFNWYSMIFKAFAILLCVAGVAVVFKNSCDLNEFLNHETDQLKVIQAFEAFREFVESINEITGPILFGIAIVCAPTFYVANLSTIFIQWNSESPITWLTVLLYGFILTLAAEVTNNTDEFREWILECGEGPFEEQLFANFVDLTQKPLGLRGMECFTVTHGFLAQIFSAVVTFTIILLQFQNS